MAMAVSFSSNTWSPETERRRRRVPVVYYLSRNGHLDQPHFMEVPLSSPHALFLSDVITRLNLLRGKSMARHYSWSSKRSYKNGFVWHDLADNDFIYPSHGHEYVLKGSELLDFPQPPAAAADASTQTDETRRRRSEEEEELNREEISPPPSDSSPETLESLMKADGRLVLCAEDGLNPMAENFPSNRMKASSVLMQLLSCGSISFRDCGPASVKDERLSFVGQYKGRAGVKLENKEYFSGSLIESTQTQIEPFPALKRSSSYNADRSSQLQLGEKAIDGVRAKCIPRKHKGVPARKECNALDKSCSTSVSDSSGDQHGSKRPEMGK